MHLLQGFPVQCLVRPDPDSAPAIHLKSGECPTNLNRHSEESRERVRHEIVETPLANLIRPLPSRGE